MDQQVTVTPESTVVVLLSKGARGQAVLGPTGESGTAFVTARGETAAPQPFIVDVVFTVEKGEWLDNQYRKAKWMLRYDDGHMVDAFDTRKAALIEAATLVAKTAAFKRDVYYLQAR